MFQSMSKNKKLIIGLFACLITCLSFLLLNNNNRINISNNDILTTKQAEAATVFSNIEVTARKDTSSTIQYNTDIAATGQIEYGLTTSYGNLTTEQGLSYWQSIELTGLTEGTTYHYRIIAKDIDNNETISNDYTFTTRTQAELDALVRAARTNGDLSKTYHVKTDGDDSLDGLSTENAWQSPATAAQRAEAGDTIYLMDGTWYDEHIVFANSGIDTHMITIAAYNGTPILDGVDKTGYGILIDGYGQGRSYISITGLLVFKNYKKGVYIWLDNSHINVRDIRIESTSDIGLEIEHNCSYIVVDNVTVTQSGWNGIMVFGAPYDSPERNHHITIQNCRVYNNTEHSGIDIHTNAHNITVKNNTVWDVGGYAGIMVHNYNISDIVVENNTIYDAGFGLYVAGVKNGTFRNNVVYNVTNNGAVIKSVEDSYPTENCEFYDNTFYNSPYYEFSVDSVVKNCTFTRNYVAEWENMSNYYFGSNTTGNVIKDPQGVENRFITGGDYEKSFRVEFTDGKVFSVVNYSGSITLPMPDWYPTKSSLSVYVPSGGTKASFYITTYTMTAIPTFSSATITVNKFNTSLSQGEILVDFTANTTNGNNIDFTVGDLQPNHYYLIKRDEINYQTKQADSNGYIQFSNSQWSERNFTIQETEAPVETDLTPPNTSSHTPSKNSTSISKQTNITLHIQDNDSGVDQSSIQMTVEGIIVSPTITGTSSDYTLTYNPPTDFNYNQLVNIAIEASDLSSTPNAMNTEIYSFTIQSSPDQTPPTGSILINSGDSQTNSQTVNLTISAIDDSDVTEMKISETNNFSSATAEPYSTIKSFILSIGDGIKTIYIWFKDTIGNWNTSPYSDSIELDSTGPIISNIQSNETTNSATITFQTNELSTSYIEYGLTSNYGSQTENSSQLLTFDFQLSDLSSDTTYHYRIISEDQLTNSSNSIDQTFATEQSVIPDSTSPAAITDLESDDITQTSVDLEWTSPGDDNNIGTALEYDIRYSTSNITESNWNSAIQISGEPIPQSAGTEQSIYIAVGLSPSTKYYFAIKTTDEVPNVSDISNILSFTTLEESVSPPGGGGGGGTVSDTTPPSKPSNFTATGADKQIILKWNNPADSDFVRVKLLRKENSSPTSHNDSSAVVIYEGTNQEYTDIELNNNTTYYYSIFAYDKKPNYSEVLSISSKPIEGKTSISNGNGNQTYPEGTLLKTPSSFKIYVIINQKKKWIPTPEVFETLGYKWTSITEINKTELNNIPNYEDNLIRAIQDYKVYLIVNGIKRHIPNPEIFLNYGFEWNDVKDVNQETINQYSQNLLIKESKQQKVYYLCPERKIRRWLRSPEIFNSYNNKWEDIQVISKYEMEHYRESNLIKQFNNNDIYIIEGNTKRLIKSAEEFNTLGLDWEMVMEVNRVEMGW